MREIKYRYWYNNTKMIEVGSIQFFTDGTYIVNDELAGGVLLEYTGLKDKNGKEIYEGDIVSFAYGRGEITFGRYVTGNEQNEDIQGYMVIGETRAYALDPQSTYEVIGNIYENPNLLEVKG